jgi:aspartate racemase
MRDFRIGIVGGLGPLAGVELQKLIIEATPAEADQDHLQVITFTNPSIPDRTRSLAEDNGRDFAQAIVSTAQVLEAAGANAIAIPCMTAHSRHAQIQAELHTPLLNAVTLTQAHLRARYSGQTIGLLATDGSIKSGVYTGSSSGISWIIPDPELQRQVMAVIYQIKAGHTKTAAARLRPVLEQLRTSGATAFVLGCTELGLLHSQLAEAGFLVADPLRILATTLVKLSEAFRESTSDPFTPQSRQKMDTPNK